MRRGILYEPAIREYYEHKYNCNVSEIGFAFDLSRPHFGVSPDGLVGKKGLIEIKCAYRMYEDLLTPEVRYSDTNQPLYIKNEHYDQMQAQMLVLKKEWCDYIVYCPYDNSIYIERVPFNEIHWEMLSSRIENFIGRYLSDLTLYNCDLSKCNSDYQ
jgi:hypothetical protein